MPRDPGANSTASKAVRASIAVGQPEKATFKLAWEDRQEFGRQSREGNDSKQKEPSVQSMEARNAEEYGLAGTTV